MKKIFPALVIITAVMVINSCKKPDLPYHYPNEQSEAGVANDWYRLQYRILLERNSSLNAVYFGYIGIGLYESLQYGNKNAVSLSTKLYQMPAMPAKEDNKNYDWQVSANAAMAAMLRAFNVGLTAGNLASIDSLENAYNQKLMHGGDKDIFMRSQSFGKSIAAAIKTWSTTDNFNSSNVGYVPPVFPGAWVPTPPAYINPPINPYVSNARPFLVADLTAIAPPFPIPYSEEANSDFYKMVKNVYDVSKTLTDEQKQIALFWVDQGNGTGYTPDGHNMLVVTQALEQTKSSLAVAAEVYAKAGIAERESIIVAFRTKYAYNILRPVSYIRKVIDTTWLSFIPTLPFPEYPANHAFITGTVLVAAAKVLGDHVTLTDHAYDFRGWAPRTYTSLFQVAEEAGISRLYGGIHYMPSIKEGLSLAKDLGGSIGGIALNGGNHPGK